MIGCAGSGDGQNGQFGAIFSQNWEVPCTRKLQGTPLGEIVNTHDAEIGL